MFLDLPQSGFVRYLHFSCHIKKGQKVTQWAMRQFILVVALRDRTWNETICSGTRITNIVRRSASWSGDWPGKLLQESTNDGDERFWSAISNWLSTKWCNLEKNWGRDCYGWIRIVFCGNELGRLMIRSPIGRYDDEHPFSRQTFHTQTHKSPRAKIPVWQPSFRF